jgi:hypothetical protein
LEVGRQVTAVFKPRECFTASGHHKQTYSRVEAKRYARLMGPNVRAYNCPMCDWWHVGNKVRHT